MLSKLSLRFISDKRGTVLVVGALLLPALAILIGGTIDYAWIVKQRISVQAAADAAALTVAKDLSLADANNTNFANLAETLATVYVKQNTSLDPDAVKIKSEVSSQPTEVSVTANFRAESFFENGFGLLPKRVEVSATARVIGKPNICLLGLNRGDGGTITLEENARVEGDNCAVFSNSSHPDSIKSKKTSMLQAATICASGGYEGEKSNFSPIPYTDCPSFEDPLKSRPEPMIGGCTTKEKLVIERSRQLMPGTYCGGLEIKGNAEVTLQPGIFAIKNGELTVSDEAKLLGSKVGLFFTGAGAKMMFDRDTTISISAPEDGEMTGLLIYASRSVGDETFKILSNNARVLLGTVYLPSGTLYVETEQPVADKSAYTAIVADTIHLMKEPTLVLNTNYNESEVPVPDGIEGAGQPVTLVN